MRFKYSLIYFSLLIILLICGHAEPQHREPIMICKGDSIMPLVRSHDGALYRVDVCAVVSSAEGEIFRYGVEEKSGKE